MLPKTHILLGLIFSLLIYFSLELTIIQASLVFLSSFLIDFDHYLWYVFKKKDFSLKNAYYYLKDFEKDKAHLMVFHSILDLISLGYEGRIHYRKFLLISMIDFD